MSRNLIGRDDGDERMRTEFPIEREAKRRVLLDAVEGVRAVISDCASEAEVNATLSSAAVEALHQAGAVGWIVGFAQDQRRDLARGQRLERMRKLMQDLVAIGFQRLPAGGHRAVHG